MAKTATSKPAERREFVPAEKVVATWATAVANATSGKIDASKPHSVDTVAESLGLKRASLMIRVKTLRDKGLILPNMPRASRSKIDVAALQSLADGLVPRKKSVFEE